MRRLLLQGGGQAGDAKASNRRRQAMTHIEQRVAHANRTSPGAGAQELSAVREAFLRTETRGIDSRAQHITGATFESLFV
jgi:hypothetical protein